MKKILHLGSNLLLKEMAGKEVRKMSDQFKIGDEVVLKGGGSVMNPVMLVKSVDEKGVMCTWFNAEKESKEKVFEPELLKHFVPPSPGKSKRYY
jgi:uncharacterized protein YodC (DUF2158 family)